MADLYGKKVMDHFTTPRNVGIMKDADGIGEVGNPTCGDIMKIYIKVSERQSASGGQEEYIDDIKFQTLGCGAAIATSSMVTEMVKGKSLAEAEKTTNTQVAKELGGLPPIKMHCSNLAASALKKAIEDYKSKKYERSLHMTEEKCDCKNCTCECGCKETGVCTCEDCHCTCECCKPNNASVA